MGTKKVEGQIPEDLHERVSEYIALNRQRIGSPQSMKAFILMSLTYTLEHLETLETTSKECT